MKYEPMPGQAHSPSEEETMSVIRSVLTETDQPGRKNKPTRAERKAAAMANDKNGSRTGAFVERTAQPNPRRRSADLPELVVDEEAPKKRALRTPKVGATLSGLLQSVIAKLRDFRPSVRVIALLSFALLVFLRPHWFLIAGILFLVLVVGSFLILGSDRVWSSVLGFLNFVESRDKKRADRMRDSLDGFACRWDSVLDRFPNDWVEALYMPDLQAMKDADDAYHAAVDARLARLDELEGVARDS